MKKQLVFQDELSLMSRLTRKEFKSSIDGTRPTCCNAHISAAPFPVNQQPVTCLPDNWDKPDTAYPNIALEFIGFKDYKFKFYQLK